MSRINYNTWFYDYHKYLQGIRDNKKSFNDTKWISIRDRIKKLEEINSDILTNQPYQVVGNKHGIDKLISLIQTSGYTFDDIDDSLIDTYKMNLKNAMSGMMVNTHAVLFNCKNTDTRYVHYDSNSNYYIIDVPFDQMHFGERDEFIRQYLHKMHIKESDYFMPLSELSNGKFLSVLGFSIMISLDGYICNDCRIAFDDKGLKFKVRWKKPTNFECIVYKLDTSHLYSFSIDYNSFLSKDVIGWDIINPSVDIYNNDDSVRYCIVDIFDKNFISSQNVVPNFGIITKDGLIIKNIQSNTLTMLKNNGSENVDIIVYELKYLHELPNVYPAVNYYDLLEKSLIYTNKNHDSIIDNKGNVVYGSPDKINDIDICTPPIVIDRDSSISHETITRVFSDYDNMIDLTDDIINIGEFLNVMDKNTPKYEINEKLRQPLNLVRNTMQIALTNYVKFASITSLVSQNMIHEFESIMTSVNSLYYVMDTPIMYNVKPDIFYGNNYSSSIMKIYKPLMKSSMDVLHKLNSITTSFISNDDNSKRFNRPISEQCFICLKYDIENDCWLFDYPEIKHFNGIQNTFYVNSNLTGNEIYKFFILYTDTTNPKELEVEKFDSNTIFDFDLFYKELDKHIGCIRYWFAENKLMKLSNVLFNEYSANNCVHILSKILKGKLDDSLLKDNPSDINYEPSAISSCNHLNYDESSNGAPFTINFLFYIINMMYNSDDEFLPYFLYRLTHDKFVNRYSDIDISDMISSQYHTSINFSQFYTAPNTTPIDTSVLPTTGYHAYYGLPFIIDKTGLSKITPYRYVFNNYQNNIPYNMITDGNIDDGYFVKYSDISVNGGSVNIYHNDIDIVRRIMKYTSMCYDYISSIKTDYSTSFNKQNIFESFSSSLQKHINDINSLKDNTFVHPDTLNIIDKYFTSRMSDGNNILKTVSSIRNTLRSMLRIGFNGRTSSIFSFIEEFIGILKRVYINYGFKDYSVPYIRNLYIHLKKINSTLNLYEFKSWLNDIDIEIIKNIGSCIADNRYYTTINWNIYYDTFQKIITDVNDYINTLDNLYSNLDTAFNEQFGSNGELTKYCEDILEHYIFDLYTIDTISIDNFNQSYSTKPEYVTVTISSNDKHISIPNNNTSTGTVTLLFIPTIDMSNSKYVITSINKICEYTFFDNEDLIVDFDILDADLNKLDTVSNVTLKFNRVSSTSDNYESFNQICNIDNIAIDIENIHESFEVVDKRIVNTKTSPMNYELLLGNKFKQLEYTSELVLNPVTYLPGSIDRIYLSNQSLNDMINSDYGNHHSNRMFFKPSQILHIDLDENNVLESINGKYFVGQTIYLMNEENDYMFPIKITNIDHGINKGFIEAIVNDEDSRWFEITDITRIKKYLDNPIKCHVISNNVSNFLNEYNNNGYEYYPIIDYIEPFNSSEDKYTFPGDPLFVQNNSDYVYTRLNWILDDNVDNRFINEDMKRHCFVYIGQQSSLSEDGFKINMINHNVNPLTLSEMYPVLRQEPNDHDIWDNEILTFNSYISSSEKQIDSYNALIDRYVIELDNAKDDNERSKIIDLIDNCKIKQEYLTSYIKRLNYYIKNLETPSTWYNVGSYESALVYIDNGRSNNITNSFIERIVDIPYTDKLEVYMYDYQNHVWIDTSSYSIKVNMIDGVKFDNPNDFKTNNVLHSIEVIPNENFPTSKKILVYLSYDRSDIFDSIQMNDDVCDVRFKPILSINTHATTNDMYSNINIRKHFDGFEKYYFENDYIPESFKSDNGYHIQRVKRSGRYTNSPLYRMCDVSAESDGIKYTYNDFDLYVKNPFIDININQSINHNEYKVTINQPIDSYQKNTKMNLICISTNESNIYNGNISTTMFECMSGNDESQSLSVLKCSDENIPTGTYICTVSPSSTAYKSCGGVISITVSNRTEDIITSGDWVKINDPMYYILPNDEFILVPTKNIDKPIYITLHNEYVKTSSDTINNDNSNTYNCFEYYNDTKNNVRLPISDTRHNNHNKRLCIDTSENPDVKVIKTSYIGICRYSLYNIPENGVIDVTGYIPTPLTRERYEFWVNGRCITDDKSLHIISPTTFQLCNLKSLKNLEVIELVDDIKDSSLLQFGNVYVDIFGNYYTTNDQSTFIKMMLSNRHITNQSIRYMFNVNQYNDIYSYTNTIVKNPNNHNIETDILQSIKFNDSNDYNDLLNLPKLNGVTLYHIQSYDIGIHEIDNNKILSLYDNIWKNESLTNRYFPMKHISSYGNSVIIRCNKTDNGEFNISIAGDYDGFFTLYISDTIDKPIDSVNNTKKIIPFVKCGIHIIIPGKYKGMFIKSTIANDSIKIK